MLLVYSKDPQVLLDTQENTAVNVNLAISCTLDVYVCMYVSIICMHRHMHVCNCIIATYIKSIGVHSFICNLGLCVFIYFVKASLV